MQKTHEPKLTKAQNDMVDSLKAQVEAAIKHPGTYSRGLTPGTVGCHKTVAHSLVKLGIAEYSTAWHGQIVDLKPDLLAVRLPPVNGEPDPRC